MFIYHMKFLDIYVWMSNSDTMEFYWTKYYDNTSVAAKPGNDINIQNLVKQ